MEIERKEKDSSAKWEEVSEAYALKILGDHYKDLEGVLDIMRTGHPINTTFAYYRMKPDAPKEAGLDVQT